MYITRDFVKENFTKNFTLWLWLCLAVLHTLGRERWPELNDLYDHLVKDLQWKVRRTLSFSLHEVAKILGTELTEKCLLSTFELFFKDLEEVYFMILFQSHVSYLMLIIKMRITIFSCFMYEKVKIGIVTNLAKFLQILSPKKREQYLYILSEVQKDALNWRFRKLLAKYIHYDLLLHNHEYVLCLIIFKSNFESFHFISFRTKSKPDVRRLKSMRTVQR